MKALVVGWFSFDGMGATAGDLMARDVAAQWLEEAGVTYEVAHSRSFAGGVDWTRVEPSEFSHVVFVCGPLGNGEPVVELFDRFGHCRLVALDVAMLQPLAEWNPFAALFERQSDRADRPDIALGASSSQVPVVGVVLVHDQKEYPGAMHAAANAAIDLLLQPREVAMVDIDTCFDPPNRTRLRTPREVETLIARTDVVVTTRLHGLVLALKNGVPALAIDPIAGGAKVAAQARVLGWPAAVTADALDDVDLAALLDWCLTPAARDQATDSRTRALRDLAALRDDVVGWFAEERAGRSVVR